MRRSNLKQSHKWDVRSKDDWLVCNAVSWIPRGLCFSGANWLDFNSYCANSVCTDRFAGMTDSGSIDLGKKVEKICKNAEKLFSSSVFWKNIWWGASGWDNYQTKPRHPTAFALCKQKCLGLQKMTLSGITPADICSLFQSRGAFRESRVVVTSPCSLRVYLKAISLPVSYVVGTVNVSWSTLRCQRSSIC